MKLKEIIEEKEDPYGNRTRAAKKWMADVTAEFEKINLHLIRFIYINIIQWIYSF